MRRREFITLIGSTAAAWPLASRAQERAMPVIGFFRSTSRDDSTRLVVAFHLALGKDAPLGRAVQRSGAIVAIPILSGLHHHYVRI
jgi:hypothetical protein